MTLPFFKYEGAGNDFIIIDERKQSAISNHPEKTRLISSFCHRRFGIGADGLMLLKNHPENDFEMVYFNSDGLEGTMCGNGGRCMVAFANDMKIIENETLFMATDGLHTATIKEIQNKTRIVSLQMKSVETIRNTAKGLFLDTGSPHLVVFSDDLEKIDVYHTGKALRNDKEFEKNGGTNVNFAQIKNNTIYIRTYERGVEDETLACGTGITATAIAAFHSGLLPFQQEYLLKARGGDLKVSFQQKEDKAYSNIYLEGPATKVFMGEIVL
jgi:diaminopimelate epimerase